MFSSKSTSPALSDSAAVVTAGPVTSPVNLTSRPSSSDKRCATGANESSGFASPFGRPKWAAITSAAPFSSNNSIVGSEALMRPSSLMIPSFKGTLRSQRRKTRFPARSIVERSGITEFYQRNRSNRLGGLSNPIHCHTNQRP